MCCTYSVPVICVHCISGNVHDRKIHRYHDKYELQLLLIVSTKSNRILGGFYCVDTTTRSTLLDPYVPA